MENITEQLAIRDQFLRNRQLSLTPQQRLIEMDQLQQRAWQILKSSPDGYEQFLRRNFKLRAVSDPET